MAQIGKLVGAAMMAETTSGVSRLLWYNETELAIVASVAIVLGAIAALVFSQYISSVYQYWRVDQTVVYKPFVFGIRGSILTGIAATLIVLQQSISSSIGVEINYGYGVIAVLGLAAIYDFFVYSKVNELKTNRVSTQKASKKTSGLLDTGKLSTDAEIKRLTSSHGGKIFLGAKEQYPIFYDHPHHIITYGEPGSSKGINSVIPNIMNWKGSLFVADPKGDLAAMTSEYRKNEMGQNVVYLNPWKMWGLPNTSFNPLQLILDGIRDTTAAQRGGDPQNAFREVDDAKTLAAIIVPQQASSQSNPQWIHEEARDIIVGLILHLASKYPQKCNLSVLSKIVGLPHGDLDKVFEEMENSAAFNGRLAQYASKFRDDLHNDPKTFNIPLGETRKKLDIYDSYGQLGKSVVKQKFDVKSFISRPTTVYVMLPKQYAESHAAWIGMVTANILETIGKYGNKSKPVMCLMDEFANMGKMENIQRAMAVYRANGLYAWLIIQNRQQLEDVYGKAKADSIQSLCNVEQYLGVKYKHAKELSDRIGEKAVKVSGEELQSQLDETIRDVRQNFSEQKTPILPSSDIEQLHLNGKQLVFINNTPMILDKVAYWQLSPWNSHVRDNPLEGSPPSPAFTIKVQ